MASTFPTNIDAFANPVYTKVDGVDVVSAAHVNDLQSAVIAVQETLAGAGRPLDMASNNFIADNTSFKLMVESLDQALGNVTQNLADHKAATAGVEHYADVIYVTPLQNLTSSNVQAAFLEHQSDIDRIMTGGFVNGVSLDDRYVVKVGQQEMEGPLEITKSLTVGGNCTLGNEVTDTVLIAGQLTVSDEFNAISRSNFNDDVIIEINKKIASKLNETAEYILFANDKMEFCSYKDFIFNLDADDTTDGAAQVGNFIINNGTNIEVFRIDEDGNLSLLGDINGHTLNVSNDFHIDDLEIIRNKIDFGSNVCHIQLDKDQNETNERFFITKDNNTGDNLASVDLLLNIDSSSTLTTGIHILKSGIEETGYFGLKVLSDNANNAYYGAGINFKHELTNVPSSITLTLNSNSINYDDLQVTDITKYGFFFEFKTPQVGAASVFGTYTTVGN